MLRRHADTLSRGGCALLPYLAGMRDATRSIGISLVLALVAATGCSSPTKKWVTIEELSEYRSIPVTIEGTFRAAALSGDTVHYQEWAAGPFRTDAPIELAAVYQSDDSLVVATPYGYLTTDVLSLRLFIGSYFSRTFNPENSGIAPFAVQKLLERSDEVLSVQEFLLHPVITYFARVARDSAGPGGPYRTILEIAPRPFDGRRLPPPTPSTR